MRAPGAPLVSLVAVAGGCTLIAPLDGLQGHPEAGASDAAGTDGTLLVDSPAGGDTATPSDGPVDAAAHDTSNGGDALADTTIPSDAHDASVTPDAPDAPLHYCASLSPAPVLCEDFDEGTAFDAKFTTKYVASTAHLGADGAYAKSAPDSLFSTTDTSTPFVNSYAFLSRSFTGTSTRVELAFDVLLLQTVQGAATVAAAVIADDGQATQHQLAFVLGSTNTVEESFAGADGGEVFLDTPLAVAPAVGTWSRVDIILSLAQRTVTVTVDGQNAINAGPLDPSWQTSGVLTVEVGMGYVSATSGPWAIRYDDVVANPQ